MRGVLKLFDRERGFGFLMEPRGDDVFFHAKDLLHGTHEESLSPGSVLEYATVIRTPKGLRALQVRLVV